MSNKIQYNKVVTRFAPSPTGFMHIGGVRTALFAWLWARKNNGTFILRIEDTDKKREVEGSIDHIMASLKWLGIDWDEGVDIGGEHAPYKQSKRLYTYKKYANILVEKGLAYADPYSEEEVANFRKSAEENKKPFLYRKHRPENPPLWDGSKPLRLKTNVKKHKWHDLVRGDLEAGEEAVDDLVLIKSDGYPTYNFAHIIDDLLMKVTHIFRADEFISSTPNYLAIYEALEIKRPEFVTLPPILGEAGTKKLGKRDGAKDILDYQKEGYLPEAMLNFLAFIGWNPGEGDNREILSKDEIIKSFEIKHIQISGAKFNEEKLDWINKEHMKLLSPNEIEKNILEWLPEDGMRNSKIAPKLTPLIFERISKWGDVKIVASEFKNLFYAIGFSDQESPVWKNLENHPEKFDKTSEYLQKVLDLLKSVENWTYVSVKGAIEDYAKKEGNGNVFWPMRFALSGEKKSPDPFSLAEALGKVETMERISKLINFLRDITKPTITDTKNISANDQDTFNNSNKTGESTNETEKVLNE
ncbi:glutamate--tRNA ligase [Candidatus Nomurabacteria bacterium RIFCSPHIGHO2_02_FULL_37_45]|nr:MAG: glutamate--tRNA ligase [Candidatus Nomurabacteria bacterium RIFCSPHIGHO2_02_FULL_37_45]